MNYARIGKTNQSKIGACEQNTTSKFLFKDRFLATLKL